MKDATQPHSRIASIDAYRGYAVFGMILVNFLGRFESMPWHFKHHDAGFSYADTIAPLFIFVVGMGFRLSLQRRITRDGPKRAYLSALRRYVLLILIGIVLYGPVPGQWRYWWDALVDIGFSGILALPFLLRSGWVRAAVAAGYLAIYQGVFMFTQYGDWTMRYSIDGGPLGPLSWVSILLLGTIAYDLVATGDGRRITRGFLFWGIALCALGWLLHASWPGIKSLWPYSQRAMTAPYPLLATGLCFLMYLPFYYLCDLRGWRFPHLRTLGMNALVVYIVQAALGELLEVTLIDRQAPASLAVAGFLLFYGACYGVALALERRGIVVKL